MHSVLPHLSARGGEGEGRRAEKFAMLAKREDLHFLDF